MKIEGGGTGLVKPAHIVTYGLVMGASRLMHVVMKLATPDVDKRFYHSPWENLKLHALLEDDVSTHS